MDRRSDRDPNSESPHDILAAEEFALGEGDPVLHREPATDVLAAEAFAMPAAEHHALPPGAADGPRRSRAWRPFGWLGVGIALIALLARRRSRR